MRERALETKILRLINRANREYHLINPGDRILVALSGGKDSYSMMWALTKIRAATNFSFDLVAYHLDQGQPNYDGSPMQRYMDFLEKEHGIKSELEHQNTYERVAEKTEEGKSYCSLCSRFRRAILYKAATRHGCNKVALGHHRDDLIETLLLNLFFAGSIKGMPPRLLSDAGTHEVIRPLSLVPEEDLIELSEQQAFEIMPCTLCGSQQSQRKFVKGLLSTLEAENPHLKGNLLHALGNVQPSQLMDPKINPLLGKLTSSISAGEVAAQAAIGDDDDTIVVRRKEPQPTSLSILS